MPMVRRLVRTLSGRDPKRSVDPDLAVSLGAAVSAGIADGITDVRVLSAWQSALVQAFYQEQLRTQNKAATSTTTTSPSPDPTPTPLVSPSAGRVLDARKSLLRKRSQGVYDLCFYYCFCSPSAQWH